MVINKLTIPKALGACHLDDTLSPNKVHYQVEWAKKLLPGHCEIIIVEYVGHNSSKDLPLTDSSNCSDQSHSFESTTFLRSKSNFIWKTLRQASKPRVAAKVEKEENDTFYKQTMKEATVLVLGIQQELSWSICSWLNVKYGLHQAGRKFHSKTTVNHLAASRKSGLNPMKRGPPIEIPTFLLEAHPLKFLHFYWSWLQHTLRVCHVGTCKISGKQIKRLIDSSICCSSWE